MSDYVVPYRSNVTSYSTYNPMPLISWPTAEAMWERARQEIRANINAHPSKAFELTKFHIDEEHYATFPQAKHAAIKEWLKDQFMCQQQAIPTFSPEPPAERYDYPVPDISHHHQQFELSTSRQSQGYLPTSEANHPIVATTTLGGPEQSYALANRSETFTHETNQAMLLYPTAQEVIESDGHPTLSQEHLQTWPSSPLEDWDVPSSPTLSDDSDGLLSLSPASDCSSSTAPPFLQPALSRSRSLPFTGDWLNDAMESMKQSAQELDIKPSLAPASPPSQPSSPVVAAPSGRHRRDPAKRRKKTSKNARVHPYPTVAVDRKSPSPEDASESGSPKRKHSRQIRDKDGKPWMACFFCRGRKIACRPPTLDGVEPCNQCTRRNLDCKYPVENRRGMRKRKVIDEL